MQINYKQYILSILLCIWMGIGWAQDPQPQKNWVLNNPESTSKNYVAQESIKLQSTGSTSGFSFQAAPGKTFNAKIDAGLLFPETDNTYMTSTGGFTNTPALGAIVGSIPGSASVSPTGGATYQIPIEVPAGINGMQPQIAVVYNSQGGFGTLGQSWELSGASVITRGGKSIYYDNQNNTVKFDNTDALYLDGQRLIYLSGGTGNLTDGATYATEVENYSVIVFTNSGFTLTTVDGKTLQFGVTTDSRIISAEGGYETLGWKLNKVTDTYGNSMTYAYTDYGQYLSHINYAGQSVEFAYNHTMAVAKRSYISNFLISQTKLLTAIITKSGSTVLKTMGFSYKSTSDNRLDKISTTARDNSKLKETVVNWGTESAGISQVMLGDNLDYNLGQNKGSVYAGDVNGDGYADRIELWPGANCNNNANKGHVFVRLFNATTRKFNTNIEGGYYFCPDEDLNPKLTVGDVDNDGKAEIILYKKNWLVTLGLSNNTLIEIHPGISFDLEDIHQGYNKNRKYEIFTTNVNNDKYPDVVMVFGYFPSFLGISDKRAGYTVFKGDEAGLTKVYDRSFNDDNAFKDFQFGDFDADGKMDVVGKVSYNWFDNMPNISQSYDTNYINFYTDIHYLLSEHFGDPTGGKYTLDFDGDGIPETLTQILGNQGVNSYKWLFENKSDNLHEVVNPANSQSHPEETYQMYPIDYNGDGLVDLIQGDEITRYDNSIVTNWHFYKNKGNLNFESENNTIQTNSRLNGQTVFVSDINGDGVADLVFPSATVHINKEIICPENSTSPLQSENLAMQTEQILPPEDDGCYEVTSSYTTHEYSAFTMPNVTQRNQVVSVTDGMGQTNSFTYKNFSAYDQTPMTGVVRNLKAPIPVVDAQTDPQGSVTTYTFEKPKVHTEGKGFLGFTTVTAVNTTKNAKVVSNYGYETAYYSTHLLNQTVSTSDGTKIISASKQYNGVRVIDAGTKRYIPIVTAQWSFDKLKNVVQKTTTDYSLYPTISQTTEIKDSTTNVVDLTSTSVSTFTGPEGCLIPYLPSTVTSTRTQAGQSDTQSTSYSYEYSTPDPNIPTKKYQIKKSTETTNSGNTLYAVTTEYSNPDAWGHMRNIAVKAKDQTGAEITRGSSMSYSSSQNPTGRFIVSKTNTLNETTTYEWNETLGLLKSETTVVNGKNRTTSYKYNGWGQLAETIYPDGIRKANTVQWTGNTTVPFYTYSETSGSSPVWTYYDNKGREVRKKTKGLNGNVIRVFTTYRSDGKVDKVSDPTFSTTFNPAVDPCTTYGYNSTYGYLESATTPLGITSTVYDKLKTTVTSPEGTSETVTNAAGQTLTSKVNEKKVSYEYFPNGLTKSSTPEGGLPLTMKYNPQGKRTLLVDPDGGTVRTEYNGWGELTKEVQKVHINKDSIVTDNTYDTNGLLLTISRNTGVNTDSEITTYIYDTQIKARVNSIELKDKNSQIQNRQVFGFDEFNRVTKVTEDIIKNGVARTYISEKVYDALGRLKKEIYPSKYYTVNTYDQYSNLTEVKDKLNRSIWKVNAENALGQATSINKGAKETKYEYDPINHLKTSIYAAGVINYTYGYYRYDDLHHANNLEWRIDGISNQREHFTYDPQNRLTNWDVYKYGAMTKQNSMSFDDNGNITQKSDLGAFTLRYGGKNPNGTTTGRQDGSLIGPHALSTISGVPASPFPQTDLTVEYTDFKKIKTLTEGNKYYELTYGVDDQRRMSVYKEGGVTKLTRYYLGDYEEEVLPNGNVRKIHYLSGAILIQNTNSATDSLLYTYSDAQGSLIVLTDANGILLTKTVNGTPVEIGRFAYDPWGARRDPNNWTLKESKISFIINRGYTGHEHLDAFGIINMNGRVYDPFTAMFFTPDPQLQAPGDWLNYNRYGYCFGNPFKYTDPSGEIFWLIPVAIGAAIGAYSGWKVGKAAGATGLGMFGYIAGGALIGGVSGYAGFAAAGAVSTAIGTTGGSILGAAVGGATAGAINGGSFAAMGGGNILNGMLIGAASGFVAGGIAGGLAAIAPSFTQANLFLRYSTKALYSGMTGSLAAGGAMFTSDLLDDGTINTSGKDYLQGMAFGGALSMGISLGTSAYDYATWDHYTDNQKAAMLTQKYGYRFKVDNTINTMAQLDVDLNMSQCQNYIRISSQALATRSMAYSIGLHEMTHLADFNSNLQINKVGMGYKNANNWTKPTEQNATRNQLLNANKGYPISGNVWNQVRDYGVSYGLQNIPRTYTINQLYYNLW